MDKFNRFFDHYIMPGAILGGLVAILLALSCRHDVGAQPGVRPVRLFTAFDVDAGTFVYCDVGNAPSSFIACDTGGGGGAAEDGWIGVRGMGTKLVFIRVDAIALTAGAIQFTIEGRWTDDEGNLVTADLIAPIDKTAVAAGQPVRLVEDMQEIRVGVRIDGTDDGDASPDDVTVHIHAFQ